MKNMKRPLHLGFETPDGKSAGEMRHTYSWSQSEPPDEAKGLIHVIISFILHGGAGVPENEDLADDEKLFPYSFQAFFDGEGNVEEMRFDAVLVRFPQRLRDKLGQVTVTRIGTYKSDPPPSFRWVDGEPRLMAEDEGRNCLCLVQGPKGSLQEGQHWLFLRYLTGVLPRELGELINVPKPHITSPKPYGGLGRVIQHEKEKLGDTSALRNGSRIEVWEREVVERGGELCIAVPALDSGASTIQGLIESLTSMAKKGSRARAELIRRLPRFVAAVYAAAQEDERLGVDHPSPGRFLDKKSGARLAMACGWDHSQTRYKGWAKDLRALLQETVYQHTQTVYGEKGKRTHLTFSEPIIKELPNTNITITNEQTPLGRGGTFQVYEIHPLLWRLQDPSADGPTDFFQMPRAAFQLGHDDHFNIYVAILNRLHQSANTHVTQDRVQGNIFEPRLATIWKWAGLGALGDYHKADGTLKPEYERPPRPNEVRQRLVEALTEANDLGLIIGWEGEELKQENITTEELVGARVRLELPDELLNTINPRGIDPRG